MVATAANMLMAGADGGLWPGTQQFLFGVLGAFISGSLVAGVSAYFSEKGRRMFIKEEWPKLLSEAREKAYEEEKGKRLATKDDIDNVINQVDLVTKATENAKAEITNRLIGQQWQSSQKREVYVRLIDALERIEIKRGILKRSVDDTVQAMARRDGIEAIEEFRRARVLAELVLAPEAVHAAHGVIRNLRPVFEAGDKSHSAHTRALLALNGSRKKIVEIARAELGLSDASQSSMESPRTDDLNRHADGADTELS